LSAPVQVIDWKDSPQNDQKYAGGGTLSPMKISGVGVGGVVASGRSLG